MRFFKVAIGGQVFASSLTPGGQIDPGSPWVVMDISQGAMNVPGGDAVSTVKIWGISLQTAGQASNFNGKSIQVFGGMSPGLPLATAQAPQQGLLVQGLVLQAFSTFVGTSMNIELLIGPGYNGPATAPGATVAGQSKVASGSQFVTPGTPLNVYLVWQPNQKLGDVAALALRVALPQMTVTANVSSTLVNTSGQIIAHVSPNLASFARWLTDRSVNLMTSSPYGGAPGGYRGIQTSIKGNQLTLSDGQGSTQQNAKAIAFTDLIGQISWQGAFQVLVTTVLRGDLAIGMAITLPPAQIQVTNPQGFAPNQPRDTSIFSGTFVIDQLRHVGDSRSPDGTRWVTLITAHPATSANSNIAQPPAGNVTIDSIDINPNPGA
jgi:hypothetical protein